MKHLPNNVWLRELWFTRLLDSLTIGGLSPYLPRLVVLPLKPRIDASVVLLNCTM